MPSSSDRDLLCAIYRRLDRQGLLEDQPGLTEEELVEFFRRWNAHLEGHAGHCGAGPSGPATHARAGGPVPTIPAETPSAHKGRIILYTDGGSRGNPGPSAFGIVLSDETGRVLRERGEFIGAATNNEAEYGGLIAGLEEARDLGARDILIRSDSLLLVCQITGRYKVKSRRLMPLVLRARQLLAEFPTWRAEHIPREKNSRADALANEAMDRGA